MSADLTGLAYLIAAICFILALRGLSSPVTARRGNFIGIAGMVVAIAATLANPHVLSYSWIVGGILLSFVGAAIQQSGVSLHQHFNHNDLFHVVQMVAFYLLYRGGKALGA